MRLQFVLVTFRAGALLVLGPKGVARVIHNLVISTIYYIALSSAKQTLSINSSSQDINVLYIVEDGVKAMKGVRGESLVGSRKIHPVYNRHVDVKFSLSQQASSLTYY